MLINKELDLAWEFIEKTNRNVFLTGKAGTGKTTFLHRVKTESLKRMVIVAPTGVAAINARGVTIHSFFQMPFGPVLPEGTGQAQAQRKFNRKKIDIIRSLDLVIIDEISMVRADLLDGIDQVLRRYRGNSLPFGGVQILMIGDLQQLAPVVKPNEWDLLREHYANPYFFSSKAYQKANPINIELKHIYRQDDQFFINILNEIRDGKISPESQEALNKRHIQDFVPPKDEGYITLTTHNTLADQMNQTELSRIKERTYTYKATVADNFPEHSYPTAERLVLKKGAQVMFIKNDSNPLKRYFNGKIGTITSLDDEGLTVSCPGDFEDIDVTRETWENIKYTIDRKTKEINSDVQGSFSQIPLRLAWAITIHKSQGLTFDRAVIDAQASFTHGQTYVALSRCKTLEGIVLKRPINQSSIINDGRVTSFTKQVEENLPDNQELNNSKKKYELDLIYDLLDYQAFVYPLKRLTAISSNNNAIKGNIFEPLYEMLDGTINQLISTNKTFSNQLAQMSADLTEPLKDQNIQARIKKAVDYFKKINLEKIKEPLDAISYSTENQTVKNDLTKHFKKLNELLHVKTIVLNSMTNGFSASEYLTVRAKAVLDKPKKEKERKEYDFNGEHASLIAALRSYRSDVAAEQDLLPFHIFPQTTLFEIIEYLPTTLTQLEAIHGIGKVKIERYGEQIIQIVKNYCDTKDITPEIDILLERPPKKKKQPKGSTKKISFDLFKKGKTVEEIAQQRGLVPGTIESHLVSFVLTGELQPTDLMPADQYEELTEIMKKYPTETLTDIRKKTNQRFSFRQLGMVRKLLDK